MNAALALPAAAAPRAGFATPRRRGFALGIVLLHGIVIWAVLQVPAAQREPVPAEPVAVRLIAAVTAAVSTPLPQAAPAQRTEPAQPRLRRESPPAASSAVWPESPADGPRPATPQAEPAAALAMPAAAIVEPSPPAPSPAPVIAVAAPALPPEAAPAAPRQIPASAVQYLSRVLPVYSPASVRAREAGRVVARVLIDEAGQPRTVQVQQSSHFVRLDDACTAAVRQSRFKPYTDNGQPAPGWALVPCDFEL